MLHRGEIWDAPYVVIRCGPGKVNAAAAAQAAVQYFDPEVIFTFGTAGCPDHKVRTGTVTVATKVIDAALSGVNSLPLDLPDKFAPDANLTRHLLQVPGTEECTLMCSEGHMVSPLWRPLFGSDLSQIVTLDWESAGVAQVAQMWGIRWAAVKVISDHGEEERLRLLALVAKRPLQWGAEVLRRGYHTFAQGSRRAREGKGCGAEQLSVCDNERVDKES
jgi:adenosylhomocysteine nucleosidase